MAQRTLVQRRLCCLAVFLSLSLLVYMSVPGLERLLLGHQVTRSTNRTSDSALIRLDLGPEVGRATVFVREAAASNVKGQLLLLHGAAFTSRTWHELGTMHFLANHSFRAVALDLPGYGKSPPMASLNTDELRAFLLLEVFRALHMERPILVSPSMSGKYSLPLLMSHGERLRAFVPVAPVHTTKFKINQYETIQTPTLIVYGAQDKNLGIQSLQRLIRLPNHRVLELPVAGHSAYRDQPDLFHQGLLDFLLSLPK